VGEVLSPVHTRVKHLLKSWQEPSFWSSYAGSVRRASPSPIQRAHARIKRPESVVDKILRKSHNYSGLTEASLAKMTDTVGARIVVHYLSNLSLVDKAIRGCQELEISTENPPTAYLDIGRVTRHGLDHLVIGKKDSGYTSLHYIVRFRDGINGATCPWFEIQARTMAEDLWAEIELAFAGFGLARIRTQRQRHRAGYSSDPLGWHCCSGTVGIVMAGPVSVSRNLASTKG